MGACGSGRERVGVDPGRICGLLATMQQLRKQIGRPLHGDPWRRLLRYECVRFGHLGTLPLPRFQHPHRHRGPVREESVAPGQWPPRSLLSCPCTARPKTRGSTRFAEAPANVPAARANRLPTPRERPPNPLPRSRQPLRTACQRLANAHRTACRGPGSPCEPPASIAAALADCLPTSWQHECDLLPSQERTCLAPCL